MSLDFMSKTSLICCCCFCCLRKTWLCDNYQNLSPFYILINTPMALYDFTQSLKVSLDPGKSGSSTMKPEDLVSELELSVITHDLHEQMELLIQLRFEFHSWPWKNKPTARSIYYVLVVSIRSHRRLVKQKGKVLKVIGNKKLEISTSTRHKKHQL